MDVISLGATLTEEPLDEDCYDALVTWLKDQVMLREPRILRSTLEPGRCLRYLNGDATRFWHSSLLKPQARSHLSHCRLQPPALTREGWAFVADCLETYTWLPLHSELIESFGQSTASSCPLVVLPLSDEDALLWQPTPGPGASYTAPRRPSDHAGCTVVKRQVDLSEQESRCLIKQVPLSTMAHLALDWYRRDAVLQLSYNNKAVRLTVEPEQRAARWTLPRFYQFAPAHVFQRIESAADFSDAEDL